MPLMNPGTRFRDPLHHADVFLQRHDRLGRPDDGKGGRLLADIDAARRHPKRPPEEALEKIRTERNDTRHAMSVQRFQRRISREIAPRHNALHIEFLHSEGGLPERLEVAPPSIGDYVVNASQPAMGHPVAGTEVWGVPGQKSLQLSVGCAITSLPFFTLDIKSSRGRSDGGPRCGSRRSGLRHVLGAPRLFRGAR